MWQANKHFALKLIYFNSGQLQISDVIYLFVYLFIYLFYLFTLFNVDCNFNNIY